MYWHLAKKLACTIIPLEEILILFGRVISARVKSNLARLGVTVLEREGKYFVRYGDEVIFSGDREAVEKFIGEKLENEESKVKIFLDELVEKVKGLGKIRKTYNAGKQKNVAFSKGEIGGNKINFESVSGGEKAHWSQKGNFEPPIPENYHFKGAPENKVLHTEQKIFEHLYLLFKNNKNVAGKIEIVTDLKFCKNCNWIIEQFKKEFKNIEVVKRYIKEKL